MKTSSAASKHNTGRKKTVGARNGSSAKKTSSAKKSSARPSSASSKTSRTGKSIDEMNEYQDRLAFEQWMTWLVMGVVMVLCYLSYLGLAGRVGTVIGGILFGMCGWTAWLLPIGCFIAVVFAYVNGHDPRVPRKIISAGAAAWLLAALTDLVTDAATLLDYYQRNRALHSKGGEGVFLALQDTLRYGKMSGGLLGHWVSQACTAVLGKIGAGFLLFGLFCVCLYIFYGIELMRHLRKRNAYYQEMEQAYEVIQQEDEYQKPSYQVRRPKRRRTIYSDRRMQTVDLQQMGKQLDQQEEQEQQKKLKQKSETAEHFGNRRGTAPIEEILPNGGSSILKKATAGSVPPAGTTDESSIPQAETSDESSIPQAGTSDESSIPQAGTSDESSIPQAGTSDDQKAPRKETDEIPIYREEMRQKFGGRKNKRQPVQTEEIEPVKHVIEMDASSEPVKHAVEMDASHRSAKHADEVEVPAAMVGNASSKVVLPEQEQAANKAMASFAPKEKVVNITPSTQKTPAKEELHETPKRPYQFPSMDLLSVPEEIPGRTSDAELRATAFKLQETLRSFHVNVTMGAVTCGPTVTRYELLPEQGVRVNKITNLADDLKLSLAAPSIRIEAPIPGKSAVGIEVPNPSSSPVYFRELLEGDAFRKAKSPLTFAVGKDIAGTKIMTDIAKMPHLLIAGATGSGKSVCINTLIMSILYKADPSDVKLIMIDPKVVELSVYNGIPHLFCPVVTDPKEAAASLNWAVREMMDRYNKFKELGVRNISGYNQKIQTVENAEKAGYEKMPSLVIIVDEFADLMMVASKEVEDAVCRLAQLARAAGIHLVLATQRPSVNVITGVIKANIPSRIAFSVSSAIDSRTILDKGGAEKLLGKGDMLFFPAGYSEPVRVQGAFISDKEVSKVVESLIQSNEQPEYNHSVTEITEEMQEGAGDKEDKKKPDQDEYFAEAGRFVIESDRAAAGQLQRRFSIGFNRAGRIIDQLHRAGVVGPAEGTKPRRVLMTMAEFEGYLAGDTQTASDTDEIAAVAEALSADGADDDLTAEVPDFGEME